VTAPTIATLSWMISGSYQDMGRLKGLGPSPGKLILVGHPSPLNNNNLVFSDSGST